MGKLFEMGREAGGKRSSRNSIFSTMPACSRLTLAAWNTRGGRLRSNGQATGERVRRTESPGAQHRARTHTVIPRHVGAKASVIERKQATAYIIRASIQNDRGHFAQVKVVLERVRRLAQHHQAQHILLG